VRNAYKPTEYSSRESILMGSETMKARTIGIVAAAGLAALISGCKAKPQDLTPGTITEPAQPEEQYPKIVRTELLDGYKLEKLADKYTTEVTFVHNNIRNECGLVKGLEFSFTDENCDGTVDGIYIWGSGSSYSRGEQGTENLFANADITFANYRQELGVSLSPKELPEQPQVVPEPQILPEQPQERIWSEVLKNVYFLNNKPGSELPDAIFTAGGDIVNLDSLWVKNPNEVYADYGRDGIVDEVASSITGTRYYRNAETADLFRRADTALAQAKAEIGLEE
jgi:hypothetical protein